jgi:hypothetical protein
MVLTGTTIGSSLNGDPWGSLATYDLVSTGGLNPGEQFNINSHGNVYAPGANGSFNFNGGGHRDTCCSSGIDFALCGRLWTRNRSGWPLSRLREMSSAPTSPA